MSTAYSIRQGRSLSSLDVFLSRLLGSTEFHLVLSFHDNDEVFPETGCANGDNIVDGAALPRIRVNSHPHSYSYIREDELRSCHHAHGRAPLVDRGKVTGWSALIWCFCGSVDYGKVSGGFALRAALVTEGQNHSQIRRTLEAQDSHIWRI